MTNLFRVGGSVHVRLPKQVLDSLGWKDDDEVCVKVRDGCSFVVINLRLETGEKDEKVVGKVRGFFE